VGIRSSAVSFIFESIIFFFAHMFFIFELLISCVFVSYELSCVFLCYSQVGGSYGEYC
jgi:hypothetical protein